MFSKQVIYRIVEKGSHGKKLNSFFDYLIISLIVLSIVSMVLESMSGIDSSVKILLRYFNLFTVLIFTLEYIARLYISDLTHPSSSRFKSVLKFCFSIGGLIDLFAILPFFLPLLFKIDLRFLRTLRLIRFLRLLKINRYTDAVNLLWTVIKEKKPELSVTGLITLLLLVFSSFVMYIIEGEKQPNAFPDILSTFWWAVTTLTTVGYGDVYPVTGLGKIISGLIALLGIGLVALPTGIIGAGFVDKLNTDKKCPNCGCHLES